MKTSNGLLPAVTIVSFFLLCFVRTGLSQNSKPVSVPYTWKNVQYVGGGFVDGIVFHPTAKGVCYCRTDMGGAYRRNPETLRWEPLLDWLSYADLNLMGVESIALDPSDPDKLYLACGTYTNPGTPDGAILRSNDRGNTFQRTDVPFKMGGNEDGRGNGERMAVDPDNCNILILGTRQAGLWKSTDGAVSWKKVESFPDVKEKTPANMFDQDSIGRWKRMNRGSGIIFVLFDPGKPGWCKRMQDDLCRRFTYEQGKSLPKPGWRCILATCSRATRSIQAYPCRSCFRRHVIYYLRKYARTFKNDQWRGMEIKYSK